VTAGGTFAAVDVAAEGFGVWATGSERALRGGSWNNNDQNTRAAYRNNNNPYNRNNNIGFRVAEPLSMGDRNCGSSKELSPRVERSTLRPPVSLHTGRDSAKSLLVNDVLPSGRLIHDGWQGYK
jgi:hypothetical protein